MAASDHDRRTEMIALLQEAINALIVPVESGFGFDYAMYHYGQEADNELSQAFARAVEETGSGVRRRDAARNIASQIDVPEVTAFIEAVIHADEKGIDILETLKDQAARIARIAGA